MDRRDAISLVLQSLLLLLLLAALIGFFEYGNYRKNQTIAGLSIARNLDLLQLQFSSDLKQLTDEVTLAARSPALERYLSNPDTTALTLVQDGYLSLSNLRKWYDQVRFIDQYGKERIRVDRRDGISQLNLKGQDKSQRDYVQAGLALTPEQVYLSDIDLNIEHGQVEVPYMPMIRVVAPVERGGVQQGITVINAKAEVLLARLRQMLPMGMHLVMLNSQGGWIAGGGERNWGFVFNAGAGLAQEAPSVWQLVRGLERGQFEYQGACYHFSWYQASPEGVLAPRWLLAGRQEQPCSALVARAWEDGAVQLLIGALFSLPLLWLWHWSRLRERQLQRQRDVMQAQLKMVTDQADLGLLMVDSDCRARWVNPEAQRLLGWSDKELLGQNLHQLVHMTPDGKPLHDGDCPTLKALATGQRYRNDNDRMLSRSGEVLSLSVRVNAFGDGKDRQAIVTLADVSELVARELKLTLLATTDALTGALNRRSILENLQVLLGSAQMAPCVVMADIDFFKKVNDTYGHNAGDRVLVSFVNTVRSLLRKDDLLARLGGEEFVIALNHAELGDAVALAERVRKAVQDIRCGADDGSVIEITASFGVAQFSGDETVEQLLARADLALYEAKRGGRNRVVQASNNAEPESPPTAG